MELTRSNPLGMMYKLVSTIGNKTIIEYMDKRQMIMVSVPIEELNQAWYNWERGELVQNAFSMLTANEREFLITGFTPGEWNKIFDDEEEY